MEDVYRRKKLKINNNGKVLHMMLGKNISV